MFKKIFKSKKSTKKTVEKVAEKVSPVKTAETVKPKEVVKKAAPRKTVKPAETVKSKEITKKAAPKDTSSKDASNKEIPGFDKMDLSPEILKGLDDLDFKIPTPIQSEAIPVVLNSSRDLIGFAQTGTGKTGAFALPIVQQVDSKDRHVQALVLCPTRELCVQITKDIKHFAKYLPKTKAVAIYGGSSMYQQLKKLDEGAQIVVGTPGRVTDLVKRGKLKLGNIRWLVLDEADDMLDKGFKDDLDTILDTTPKEKQTLLFSATMSSWIQKVAQQRMHDPKEIKVAAKNQGAENVQHQYVTVHARDRYAALRRILDVNPDVYGIVFCRTRRDTKEVAAKLITNNYSAQAIHGDISQDDRSKAMDRFRSKQIQILVATDVAARGIDVNDLTHVINYELPDSPETYVHRSGRTGRAGKKGIALTIINMRERGKLRRIEGIMRKKFAEVDVPTGKEICEAQLMSLIHGVKTTDVDMDNLEKYLPAIYEELSGLSNEEVIQHFVSVEFNRFLAHYSNVKDISTQRGYGNERGGRDYNRGGRGGRDYSRGGRDYSRGGRDGRSSSRNSRDGGRSSGRRDDRGGRSSRGGDRYADKKDVQFKTYQLNFGRKDGFGPKALFDMINNNQSLRGIEIGTISPDSHGTTFEADARYNDKIIRFIGQEKFKGQAVRISPR